MDRNIANTIDEYIAAFPAETQQRLYAIRELIRKNAPEASEKMSYAMPTFYLNGNLVHFAAFKNHIGFYPGSEGVEAFEAQLAEYKHAKGSIQFPLKKELPLELIEQIVKFRVEQNTRK